MRLPPFLLAATSAAALSVQPVQAQQALKDVAYVTEGLIAVGIAYELSEVCDDIDARLLRGLGYLNQLKSHAKGLGFSNAEIDAYTDNKAEQDRLEQIARARLVSMGATPGDEASHCAVGRSEISKQTTIGYLLR